MQRNWLRSGVTMTLIQSEFGLSGSTLVFRLGKIRTDYDRMILGELGTDCKNVKTFLSRHEGKF